MDGPTGAEHDGGVLWHVATVQFQARSESPELVMEVADSIRDLLIQFAGDPVVKSGEEVIRIDLTASPHFYGQDEQERVILAVGFEVWHRADVMRQSVGVRVVYDDDERVALVDVRVYARSFAEAEDLLADAIRQVREKAALEADAES